MPPFTSQYGGANFDLGSSSTSNFTNPNSTSGSNASPNISLSGNGPSYSEQYGQNNFTLSEERDKKKTGAGGGAVVDGINAGAAGLESVTGFFNAIMGNGNAPSNTYNPPPPVEKKTSPLLIGGIAAAVVVLIIVLILTKNGQPKE
jgi:hypothetical protein